MRDALADTITADWHKILDAAESARVVKAHHADLLREALVATTGGRRRSEFYAAYFAVLDAFAAKDRKRATRTVLGLGNVLLEDAAEGRVKTPIPVTRSADSGRVRLPAASPGFVWTPAKDTTVLDADVIGDARRTILDAVSTTWIAGAEDGIRLRSETDAIRAEIAKYGDRTRKISRLDPALAVVSGEEVEPARTLAARYGAGLSLIEQVLPEQAAEIKALTEYVVALRGRHFVGGSDIVLFGASYLRLEADWTPLCFADHLTHEATHQLLHAKQELHPLLLNRDEAGLASPIRSDPRPLYGTYHATFVFLRLACLMAAVLRSSATQWHEEARIRFHRHLLGLLQGLTIISDHGRHTPEGRRELDCWIETARELVRLEGRPSPKLYNRLDWDYDPPNGALPLFPI
ncbi:HEXXH motif-containing putative peptide modification protein [Embleya sp. NPDC056575]|uniref:aKG-HExxH-type peptide beta-hydroxylase n=1 Tax=unclassified Embleya TaxID=2699296 RepID=UPI0036930E85